MEYEFNVTLSGIGDTELEAWEHAVEAFTEDPGDPDSVEVVGLGIERE